MLVSTLCLLSSVVSALPASQSVGNPADKQKQMQSHKGEEDFEFTHSWELPAIVIPGQPASELREEDRVGTYGQPRWTTHRRFTETRVYVVPEGQAEFEYWIVPEVPRHGDTETKTQFEFEFGLPNRFQLDLYMVAHENGNQGALDYDQIKTEVRWALANWGEIPMNPTLYLEWKAKDNSPDAIEMKLLLGDELAPRWHWGVNFVYEQETGGARETGRELTGGISYTVLDEKFSIGAETKMVFTDDNTDRGNYSREYLLGPSFQYKPLKRAHIDFTTMFGLTLDSPKMVGMIIFGWEF